MIIFIYRHRDTDSFEKWLTDEKVNDETYLDEFEEFSKKKRYIDAYNDRLDSDKDYDRIQEDKNSFDIELQEKGQTSFFDSLASIDKSKSLRSLMNKSNLSQLSGEIMKVTEFAKSNENSVDTKREKSMIFLISLDYLVKGLLTHWQITLKDNKNQETSIPEIYDKLEKKAPMLNHGVQYNILIGDQFHAKAYYMTSRLGNNELWQILSTIEENFAKIIFRQQYNSNDNQNIKKLYQDFYNYLPTFFGHGFKGLAIIHEMGTSDVKNSFLLGIEYGFCVQFGIFAYIMTAAKSKESKQIVKEKLKKISSLVQVISYETLVQIIKQVSIFRIERLRKEFTELSLMHGQKCRELLEEMEVDEEVKIKMKIHLDEFFDGLVTTTKTANF